MKGGTVEINWHETKPVLSVDFHPQSSTLATAGADHDIKLWLISSSSSSSSSSAPSPSFHHSLVHHSSTVNVVRFSPSGHQLASGADGGELVIWKLHPSPPTSTWKLFKTLAFHRKDVLDLSWSPDGAFIVSGSVDNSCLIWDAIKGSVHQILDSHFHYVQGVSWDPLHKYVASLSSDRSCRIYVNKPQGKPNSPDKLNYVCHHILTKAELPSDSAEPDSKPAKSHLFHDETLPTFFRRLSWSPDGSFLLVPAGCYKTSPAAEAINTAYVFSRTDLSRPALQLPCANKPVIAVRFCPLRFTLRGSSPSGFFKLPYRLIFAVATLNSLFVYDTESISPIAVWAGLHYAAITDIAWSFDARYLALSSQDGYCTLVEFENDELGSPILLEPNERPCVDGSNPDQESATMDIEVTPNSGPTENMSMEIEANNATEKQASPVSASSRNDGPIIVDKGFNIEAEQSDGKSSTSTTPTVNKPAAKRRITPIAIDP